jgi:hypothetical protein
MDSYVALQTVTLIGGTNEHGDDGDGLSNLHGAGIAYAPELCTPHVRRVNTVTSRTRTYAFGSSTRDHDCMTESRMGDVGSHQG